MGALKQGEQGKIAEKGAVEKKSAFMDEVL